MSRVTIAGLAEILEISKASVSYALNGRPGVSEETRKRVLALAESLGWHPSSSARALARDETGVIGVVLARGPKAIGTEPYYMNFIAGIESVLNAAEMGLLVRVIDSNAGHDHAVYRRWAAEHRVDGVILSDLHVGDRRLELLDSLGLPWVLHGEPAADSGIVAVGYDNDADAFLAIDHFRVLGHRDIAYVSGPLHLVHENQRIDAIVAYAARFGMRVVVVEGDYTILGGTERTHELMEKADRPTAILYGNDLMALGAMVAVKDRGISVPEAVSVLSWGDTPLCSLGALAVSALRREDSEVQGRRSAELLLDLLAGGHPSTLTAGGSTVISRGTTGVLTEPFVTPVDVA